MIKHLVLAGDSIFDNDAYVMGDVGVIEQMRRSVPAGWSALKVALDGDCIRHVYAQVQSLPPHTTDLVLSAGGNDMIGYFSALSDVLSIDDLPNILARPMADFTRQYGALLDTLASLPVRTTVCTVYTEIPFEEPEFQMFAPAAIPAFNAIIEDQALTRNMGVIRLDQVCRAVEDFSPVSPIEPSSVGGQKIVDAIIRRLGG